MKVRKQLALQLQRNLNNKRMREETKGVLVRQLAELLLQAIQNKRQGERPWKR